MLGVAITLLIFLTIAGIVFALQMNQKAERRKRMLNVIQGTSVKAEEKEKKSSQDHHRRHDLSKKLKEAEKDSKKKKEGTGITDLIVHAGMNISVKKFWIFSFMFAVLFAAGVFLAGQSKFVVAMAFIVGLLGLPKMFLKMKAKKRQKKFLEDFADALESMMRLLKAGMPVTEAISMVAREFTGPVGEEMGRIFDQQKIGIPLSEAVLSGAKRMPLTEMQMFATAVAIQSQTGSSLSEVLENLANVIRARFSLKRKVTALSSEAKASAGIIGALPLLVMGGMYLTNRDYIMVLFEHPTGNLLLGGAGFWMFCGVMVMRQMINFRV